MSGRDTSSTGKGPYNIARTGKSEEQLPNLGRRDFIRLAGLGAAAFAVAACGGGPPITTAAPATTTTAAPTTTAGPPLAGIRCGISQWVQAGVHDEIIDAIRLYQEVAGTGMDVETVLDAGGDGVKQVTDAEAFITQNFDGAFIFNIQPEGWEDWGQRAQDAGLITITWTSWFPTTTQFIQVDNVGAGFGVAEAAAQWFQEKKGGRGKWALFELTSIPALTARTLAMEVKMAELLPDVELVGKAEAYSNQTGVDGGASLLQAHPDLDAILCFNDDGMLGAQVAALEAGRDDPDDFWLGGVDAIAGALDEMKKGTSIVQASASFLFGASGALASMEMAAALQGESIPTWRNQTALIVDAENVEQYIADTADPMNQKIWDQYSIPYNRPFNPETDVGLL